MQDIFNNGYIYKSQFVQEKTHEITHESNNMNETKH